jgi:predicted RNase H-like nuclease (RuvC/YqgF family)
MSIDNIKTAYKVLKTLKGLSASKADIKRNADLFIDKILEYSENLKSVDIDSMFGIDFETQKRIKDLEEQVKALSAQNKSLALENKERQSATGLTEKAFYDFYKIKKQHKGELLANDFELQTTKNQLKYYMEKCEKLQTQLKEESRKRVEGLFE